MPRLVQACPGQTNSARKLNFVGCILQPDSDGAPGLLAVDATAQGRITAP
jgi:hypothetical protein